MSAPPPSELEDWLYAADRTSDWSRVVAVVAGLGVSGFAAADALLRVGASVNVIDQADDDLRRERANILATLGARIELGDSASMPTHIHLLIASPGLPPTHAWLQDPIAFTVWSAEQLAWQLRPIDRPAPWLVVTGTNGKTTTVEMLSRILTSDGHRALAVGNVGRPLIEAVFAEPAFEVLAVELSSYQLHWSHRLSPHAAALLNVARDHTDWHGSMPAYVADKAKVFNGTANTIVYNVQDPLTEQLARDADVAEGCRAVGFTLGVPDVGMVGVVDGVLVDRAFTDDRRTHAQELLDTNELQVTGEHNVGNALAAAALALSWGATAASVRRGLAEFEPDPHRMQPVATIASIDYVDDSKATNVSAADVSLSCFPDVVWIAGGLAKGGQFDDLVARHRSRFVGVVLIGADRALIREAMERHAPEVPVIEVPDSDTDPMDHAVRAATGLARPDATVLLAPACASMDQFSDYAARGDAFAHAVSQLPR